jgi:hypothetical protein
MSMGRYRNESSLRDHDDFPITIRSTPGPCTTEASIMKTRFLAGLAVLAALSPAATAQYVVSPQAQTPGYGYPAAPAYGYNQPKEDCPPKFWFSTEYLLWDLKDAPVPFPLLTAGSTTDPLPGALGQPGTTVLLGGNPLELDRAQGVRVSGGFRLDPDGCFWLEGSAFWLENTGFGARFAGDSSNNLLLVRPFLNPDGTANVSGVAVPTAGASGTFTASGSSQLYGNEFNLASAIYRGDCFRLDLLAGFRYLNLNEQLDLVQTRVNSIVFLGVAQPVGSVFVRSDAFGTDNDIYAGQLGLRATYQYGPLCLGMTGKLGVGRNNQEVRINGSTILRTPTGTTSTAVGGLLAASSNIGTFHESEFVLVPEIGANVAVNVFPWMQVSAGYNFLYVNNVVRPGNQIDPVINTTLIPTFGNFGPTGAARPAPRTQDSDFFAHGLTAGLLFRW